MAAGEVKKQKTEDYSVGDDELSLTHYPEEAIVIFAFYDSDDRPDASYDGYGLLGEGGEFLGAFNGGTLCVPAGCIKSGFQITDPEGNAVQVTPKG